MSESLKHKKCKACHSETSPLKGDELYACLEKLGGTWKLVNDHQLENEYTFKNFSDALLFTNQVGAIAESENHHPTIHLSWGQVKIILWTHSIDGLSENDFILAAKCDGILSTIK